MHILFVIHHKSALHCLILILLDSLSTITHQPEENPLRLTSLLDDLSTLQSLSPPSQGRVSCGASRQGSAEEDEAPSSPPVQQQHHQHLHHPTPPVSAPGPQTSSGSIGGLSLLDYPSYMARLLASAERPSPLPSPTAGGSAETSPTAVGDRVSQAPLLGSPSAHTDRNGLRWSVF